MHFICSWPWPASKLQQSALSCFCYFIGLTVHAILSFLVWDGHLHVVLEKLHHIVSPSPDLKHLTWSPLTHIFLAWGLLPGTNKCPVQLHFKCFTASLHSSTVIKVTGTVQYISNIWLTDRSPQNTALPSDDFPYSGLTSAEHFNASQNSYSHLPLMLQSLNIGINYTGRTFHSHKGGLPQAQGPLQNKLWDLVGEGQGFSVCLQVSSFTTLSVQPCSRFCSSAPEQHYIFVEQGCPAPIPQVHGPQPQLAYNGALSPPTTLIHALHVRWHLPTCRTECS